MKRKIIAVLLCSVTGCMVFSGCEKTPEEAIVREKGTDSVKQYESAGDEKTALRERLKAPEHYKDESVYEDGRLVPSLPLHKHNQIKNFLILQGFPCLFYCLMV